MTIDIFLGPPLACNILMETRRSTLVGRELSPFSLQFDSQLAAVGKGRQGL
jgi:hypothetical protein